MPSPLIISSAARPYIASKASVPSLSYTINTPIKIAIPPATAMPRYVPAAYSASLVCLCATHINDVKDNHLKEKEQT